MLFLLSVLLVVPEIGNHGIAKVVVRDGPFGNDPVFDRLVAALDADLGGAAGGMVGLVMTISVAAAAVQPTPTVPVLGQQQQEDQRKDQQKAGNHQITHDGDLLVLVRKVLRSRRRTTTTASVVVVVVYRHGFREGDIGLLLLLLLGGIG